MTNQNANVNQQKNSKLTLQVMDDLTVQLYTNSKFDFLMDTQSVADGYGVAVQTIRSNKYYHKDELIEGKHYVVNSAIRNLNGSKLSDNYAVDSDNNLKHNAMLWTRAGVIRLGFFIKSERAKAFRDWAENIVLQVSKPKKKLPKPQKRKHNRLTQERLVDIMTDIVKIEDKNLRLSITEKLGL